MKQYDYKTISRTMLGDLHTPVSTYLKVRDIFPQSALMEVSILLGAKVREVYYDKMSYMLHLCYRCFLFTIDCTDSHNLIFNLLLSIFSGESLLF